MKKRPEKGKRKNETEPVAGFGEPTKGSYDAD
jgi:hypothetical protein